MTPAQVEALANGAGFVLLAVLCILLAQHLTWRRPKDTERHEAPPTPVSGLAAPIPASLAPHTHDWRHAGRDGTGVKVRTCSTCPAREIDGRITTTPVTPTR